MGNNITSEGRLKIIVVPSAMTPLSLPPPPLTSLFHLYPFKIQNFPFFPPNGIGTLQFHGQNIFSFEATGNIMELPTLEACLGATCIYQTCYN